MKKIRWALGVAYAFGLAYTMILRVPWRFSDNLGSDSYVLIHASIMTQQPDSCVFTLDITRMMVSLLCLTASFGILYWLTTLKTRDE